MTLFGWRLEFGKINTANKHGDDNYDEHGDKDNTINRNNPFHKH